MQLCKEQLTYFVLDERDRVEKAIPLFGSWYSKSTSELTDKGMTFAAGHGVPHPRGIRAAGLCTERKRHAAARHV